jgi:phytoene synthase
MTLFDFYASSAQAKERAPIVCRCDDLEGIPSAWPAAAMVRFTVFTMVETSRTPSWAGYARWADTVVACRAEFVRVARSFWLIPEIIPALARDDVAVLHGFCRQLDDAIDDEPDASRARKTLVRWRDELEGRATPRPLIAALVAGAERTGLPLVCADHLLDGIELDLGEVRIADDGELLRYAYRVSAAVGLMLAPLLGIRDDPVAAQRVVDLGLALQLSNVLLGVCDDARRGRVYLPATRLAAHGLTAADVLAHPTDRRLRPVLHGLAELAEQLYRSAEQGAARVPLRYRHGVILLGRAYAELGRRAANGDAAPVVPAGLPLRIKLAHLAKLLAIAGRPDVLGLTPPPPHDPALHRALVAEWPGVDA